MEKALKQKKELEQQGEETCPPQIIFNSSLGVLSVISPDEEKYKIYVDITLPIKILNLIPWGKKFNKESRIIQKKEIDRFIDFYYDRKFDYLQREL